VVCVPHWHGSCSFIEKHSYVFQPIQRNQTLNILVIDCDQIQIQSLARGLKSKGHSVSTATSKAETYSVLEKLGTNIHLLLIDSNVPHLNVFELIQRARAKNKIYPTIIMTTFINQELKTKTQGDSFIALIEKPFVLEKLIQKINWFDNPHKSINELESKICKPKV
jgi:CheY-like chemotaxis protein